MTAKEVTITITVKKRAWWQTLRHIPIGWLRRYKTLRRYYPVFGAALGATILAGYALYVGKREI
jgi:hypothetical protein